MEIRLYVFRFFPHGSSSKIVKLLLLQKFVSLFETLKIKFSAVGGSAAPTTLKTL